MIASERAAHGGVPADAATQPTHAARVFAQLETNDSASELKAAWLREACEGVSGSADGSGGGGGAAFRRMRNELQELNGLYADALRQAAALAQVRPCFSAQRLQITGVRALCFEQAPQLAYR